MLRSPTALAIASVFILVSLSPHPARAAVDLEFTWANPRPQGNALGALAFENATTGYAVGSVGATLRTTNGAQSWTVETRFPAFQATLRDVIVLGPGQLLAAGQNPGLYRSTDSGSTWSAVAHAFPSELNHLTLIPGPGPVISAIGDRILRSTDGGATWDLRPSPNGSLPILDQFWFSPTTGYVVGQMVARRTTDGGLTWQPLAGVEELLGGPTFTEVKFADAMNGWILEHFTTYRTTDGGNSWFERHGQGFVPIYQEEALVIDASRRFVITLLEGAEIWETTNDGVNWVQRYERDVTRGYTDIERLADGTFVVSSTDGDLLRSTNSGLTWTNFVSSPGDEDRTTLTAIEFLPSGKGLAGGMNGAWLESLDGGDTWEFGSGPGVGMPRAIVFRNPELGLIGGWGPLGQSKVARTTDGGNSWTMHSLSLNYTGYPQDIAFPTDQIAYVVTHGGSGINFIYRSADGGQTWSLSSPGAAVSSRLECIFFLDANTGFIGGGEFNDAVLYKTTDGGGSWGVLPEVGLLAEGVQDMHWMDAQTGVVASFDGVSRTTNGGQSWTTVLHEAVNSLDFRDPLHGYAGSYFSPVIWATSDGGITWESIITPWEGEPYKITAVADGFFLCGGGSVIMGAREAGTSGVPGDGGTAGAPPVAGQLAVRVWPNPTPADLGRGALTFGIESPVAGPIDLRIYELNGRLVDAVTATAPERGGATIAWPGSGSSAGAERLASGTYWIEARLANGARAHGRFVVLPGR